MEAMLTWTTEKMFHLVVKVKFEKRFIWVILILKNTTVLLFSAGPADGQIPKLKHTMAVESFEIIVIIKICSCHVIVVDMKIEHAKCSKEGLNIMALHNLVGWRYCVTQ